MPATSLWIVQEDKENRMMFITQQYGDNDFTVNIYHCNEDFIPTGEPVTKDLTGKEEDYHKSLRRDASSKGHYVPGHSTDPEWNPDYSPLQDTGGHDGC